MPSIRRLAANGWALSVLAFTVVEGALLIGMFNYLRWRCRPTGERVLAAGLVTAAFGATVVIVSQLMKLILWPLASLGAAPAVGGVDHRRRMRSGDRCLTRRGGGRHGLLGFAWAGGHTTVQTWMTDAVGRLPGDRHVVLFDLAVRRRLDRGGRSATWRRPGAIRLVLLWRSGRGGG